MTTYPSPAASDIGQLRSALISAHKESPIRVNADRVQAACEFLDTLPDSIPTPLMVIALDGELCFIWEQGQKCLVVVPEGPALRYSAEFGSERRNGRERFERIVLPPVVAEILDAFRRQDA
jgi:hypothetical protein